MARYYNRTAIDWCDFTFNPFTGCWGPGGSPKHPRHCPYCYAKRIAERFPSFPYDFEPTVYLDRFKATPPKEPSRIFVGSMGDVCGDWYWDEPDYDDASPDDVQYALWRYIERYPQHQWILLTKNPGGLKRPVVQTSYDFVGRDVPGAANTCYYGDLPKNLIWGISLTGDDPVSVERLRVYREMLHPSEPAFLSYEPAKGPLPELWPVEPGKGWLVIGAQTGPGAAPVDMHDVFCAVEDAHRRGWLVWVKDNAIRQGEPTWDNEWPREQIPMPNP